MLTLEERYNTRSERTRPVFYSVWTNQVVFSVSIPEEADMVDDEFDSGVAHG